MPSLVIFGQVRWMRSYCWGCSHVPSGVADQASAVKYERGDVLVMQSHRKGEYLWCSKRGQGRGSSPLRRGPCLIAKVDNPICSLSRHIYRAVGKAVCCILHILPSRPHLIQSACLEVYHRVIKIRRHILHTEPELPHKWIQILTQHPMSPELPY